MIYDMLLNKEPYRGMKAKLTDRKYERAERLVRK
jgi:hypothetical protein